MEAFKKALLSALLLVFSASSMNLEESPTPPMSLPRKRSSLDEFAFDLLVVRNILQPTYRPQAPYFGPLLEELLRRQENGAKVRLALPECTTMYPCIIRENNGGYIRQFRAAATAVFTTEDSLVVIDGVCASACALFADEARPHVCITERAVFRFHKAYRRNVKPGDKRYRFDPVHSTDINAWVMEHGGFPADDEHLLSMYADEAKWYWPRCMLNPPLPRSDPRRGMTATAE